MRAARMYKTLDHMVDIKGKCAGALSHTVVAVQLTHHMPLTFKILTPYNIQMHTQPRTHSSWPLLWSSCWSD